jgi:hypothetical protein
VDKEGASIVGIDPDFIINAEVETLPSYENDAASNPVAHGDMTASSSTENKTNVVSAAVEDDYISVGNASKTEELSIEHAMITMNMSFIAVASMPSSHGEAPMDSVIDGDVHLITCSDDIEVLLIPEVSADVNTSIMSLVEPLWLHDAIMNRASTSQPAMIMMAKPSFLNL